MAFRFTDILETVAPIGVSFIPGIGIPAAIALSAAMKGGISAAKGGSPLEVLRDAAIGAGTGAAGAAAGGAISKGLGKAATKAAEKAATKTALEKTLETGMGFGPMGTPIISPEGLLAGSQKLTEGTGLSRLLEKGATATSGALGKDPEKTAQLLKTVGSGAEMVSAGDEFLRTMAEPPRFSQQHAMMSGQHPGMNPSYQFGVRMPGQESYGSLGFGRFF